MGKRRKFYKCVCYALGLFIILILIDTRYMNQICCRLFYEKRERIRKNHITHPENETYYEVETILNKTRLKIKTDLWNYKYSDSGVRNLKDLIMESGGKPVRNLIISTWRSGSSFLGELISAMPSTFYNYEPLLKYNISKQIRGPPNADKAVSLLKNMFRCDYNGREMEQYLKFAIHAWNHLGQIKRNKILWDQCQDKEELCADANFTAKICKLFPFQTTKVVRLRLHLVKDLIKDSELNVNVVLLVRDPRAVMQSRLRIKDFCEPAPTEIERLNRTYIADPDCANPELLCADMVSDYAAAGRLSQDYPGRIMVLRFEDLALNLNATTTQLLKFLRLGATQSVNEFVRTHTDVEATEHYSTFRVTRHVPFKWKKLLQFDYANDIQVMCKEAMELWGYKRAHNASHMKSEDFIPLEPYRIIPYAGRQPVVFV